MEQSNTASPQQAQSCLGAILLAAYAYWSFRTVNGWLTDGEWGMNEVLWILATVWLLGMAAYVAATPFRLTSK